MPVQYASISCDPVSENSVLFSDYWYLRIVAQPVPPTWTCLQTEISPARGAQAKERIIVATTGAEQVSLSFPFFACSSHNSIWLYLFVPVCQIRYKKQWDSDTVYGTGADNQTKCKTRFNSQGMILNGFRKNHFFKIGMWQLKPQQTVRCAFGNVWKYKFYKKKGSSLQNKMGT